MDKANLIVYSHGQYLALGKKLGTFGYSVRKKKPAKRKKIIHHAKKNYLCKVFALRGFLFQMVRGRLPALSMQLQHGSLIFLIPAAHPFQYFFTYLCCYLLNALFV